VIWDPEATKIISSKTHHQNIDFNIFEGRKVKGLASHTICDGQLRYTNGELRVEKGIGQYVRRPAFPSVFNALKKQSNRSKPRAVDRD
ncbi:MAG: hypothetical protein L3J46_03330, partial [Kangiellaceae bacterium]|nr:hypothetical protein [Kangiellaceae bacterium]